MALSSKASAIPTTNEFLAHWSSVDEERGAAGGLVLAEKKGVIPAGFNRSGLVVLKDLLQDRLDAVQDKLNDVQIARGGIKNQKAIAYKRLTLFLELLDGYYKETDFYVARPEPSGIGAGEENFMAAMRDMKSLWPKLNGAPAPAGVTLPILLNEGTNEEPVMVPVATFLAQLIVLRGKYEAEKEALQDLAMARGKRDKTIETIRAVLVAYREAVPYGVAGNQPLLDTLPRLTPEPGHTPDAVNASAALEGTNQARISHTQSNDPDFLRYEARGAVGEDADAEDAVTLESHTDRVPADFVTGFGLGSPGAAVTLWIYVVTKDGNERGSQKMVVRRPE